MTFLKLVNSLDPIWLLILQVTVLLGLGMLIAACFRKTPTIRHCVLGVALTCALVAPALMLTTHFSGWKIVLPVLVADSSADEDPNPVVTPSDSDQWIVDPGEFDNSLLAEIEVYEPKQNSLLEDDSEPAVLLPLEAVPTMPSNPFPIARVMLGTWLAGALFFLFGIALSVIRVRRLVRFAEPIDRTKYFKVIQQAAENIGVSRYPKIGISNRIETAAVIGVGRHAWVLIPHVYLKRITDEQLCQILTHEGAHFVRCDPLIHFLQRVNSALWWWHPFVYWANRDFCRAREEICDNFVLNRTEADVYGETLLELGKLNSSRLPVALATVGLFGLKWKLEHRIQGLLNPRRKTMTRTPKSVFTLVTAVFIGLTMLLGATRLDAQEARERQERQRAERAEREARQELRERERREIEKHARETGQRVVVGFELNRQEVELHEAQRRVEHLMVAREHLQQAGLEELADQVAQRVDKMQAELERAMAKMHNQRERVRRGDAEVRRDREARSAEQRVREDQRRAEQRERDLEMERRDAGRARQGQRRSRDMASNEEFQKEIIGAIRELNAAVSQLRNEMNEMRDRQREGDR